MARPSGHPHPPLSLQTWKGSRGGRGEGQGRGEGGGGPRGGMCTPCTQGRDVYKIVFSRFKRARRRNTRPGTWTGPLVGHRSASASSPVGVSPPRGL